MKQLAMLAFTVILLSTNAALYCSAQTMAHISGYVTDSEDEVGLGIRGAMISFVSQANGEVYKTRSTAYGWFEIDLPLEEATAVEERPATFSLRQNYPNPFNPSTVIEYELPSAGDVDLSIFNAVGQVVRTLETGYIPSGSHRVVWDARDDDGNGVAAGVYIYRLKYGNSIQTRKMLLLDGGGAGGTNAVKSSFYAQYPQGAQKQAVEETFVMAVSHGDFVTHEDYNFTVSSDRRVDVALTRKTGITIQGILHYTPCHDCRRDNWDGVIEPVTIIVYDTDDYTTPHGTATISYPDTTYEITGLPEGVVDMVFQGDDVLSKKIVEHVVSKTETSVPIMLLQILYDMDPTVTESYLDTHLMLLFKEEYDNPESGEMILIEEYNCTSYRTISFDKYYFTVIVDLDYTNSVIMSQALNNDQRVLLVAPEGCFDLN